LITALVLTGVVSSASATEARGLPRPTGEEAAPELLCDALNAEPLDLDEIRSLLSAGGDPTAPCMVYEVERVRIGGTDHTGGLAGSLSSSHEPISSGVGTFLILPLVLPFAMVADGLSGEVVERPVAVASTPVHVAVFRGSTEALGVLIDAGAPLDTPDGHEKPALAYATRIAANGGDPTPFRQLLEAGASTSRAADVGYAKGILALARHDPALLDLAIEHGLDVDVKPPTGGTALQLAVAWSDEELVRLLAARGADLHVRGSWHKTPLYEAAEAGDEEMAQLLLELGVDLGHREYANSDTQLLVAIDAGDAEVVRRFLEYGADPGQVEWDGQVPLHFAARAQEPEIVQMLLEAGAEPDAEQRDKETPLQWAARHDCPACAEPLIAHGATLGKWAPAYAASVHWPQDREMSRVLIRAGLEVDRRILRAAVRSDDVEYLRFVAEHDQHGAPAWRQMYSYAVRKHRSAEVLELIAAEAWAR